MELRWYNGVLQYRVEKTVTDYSSQDPITNAPMKTIVWSEWTNVPTVFGR